VSLPLNQIVCGDCREVLKTFPNESIDFVMFSPPYYGLRDYGEGTEIVWGGDPNCEHEWVEERTPRPNQAGGPNYKRAIKGKSNYSEAVDYHDRATYSDFCVKCGAWRGQLGLEPDWRMYVEHLRMICHEIKRVLKKTGSMYIVIGDTYAGSSCGKGDRRQRQNLREGNYNIYNKEAPQSISQKPYQPKCLMGIPWRVAFALIDDGWILRNAIVWFKVNHMPESVKDRLTRSYEFIFHFVKSRKYYYNLDAIREPHKSTLSAKGCNMKTTKHDLAVGRIGSFSYTDPLHTKGYNPKGKNPGDVVTTFIKGLELVYKQMGSIEAGYQSKYKEGSYGQTLQSFIREESLARMRKVSREVAKQLFPDDERLQQDFINWVHDHAGHTKGRNPGDFWSIPTKPFKGAHFAVYPVSICVRPILSSCPPDGVILDPMVGSGTTCLAAQLINLKRWDLLGYEPNDTARSIDWHLKWIGIDINEKYVELARNRLKPFLLKTIHEYSLVG